MRTVIGRACQARSSRSLPLIVLSLLQGFLQFLRTSISEGIMVINLPPLGNSTPSRKDVEMLERLESTSSAGVVRRSFPVGFDSPLKRSLPALTRKNGLSWPRKSMPSLPSKYSSDSSMTSQPWDGSGNALDVVTVEGGSQMQSLTEVLVEWYIGMAKIFRCKEVRVVLKIQRYCT